MPHNQDHYSRRSFLQQSAALTAAGLVTPPSLFAQTNKPNIIYILVDDMGWADLSCYGQKAYSTPNLDRNTSLKNLKANDIGSDSEKLIFPIVY